MTIPVQKQTKEITGFGPTFLEALYNCAELVDQVCPTARPICAPLSTPISTWAAGDRWYVRVLLEVES